MAGDRRQHGRVRSSRLVPQAAAAPGHRRTLRRGGARASCGRRSSPRRSCSACTAGSATSRSAARTSPSWRRSTRRAAPRATSVVSASIVRSLRSPRPTPLDEGAQAAHVRRQPPGRLPAGRPLQRLRRRSRQLRGALHRAAGGRGKARQLATRTSPRVSAALGLRSADYARAADLPPSLREPARTDAARRHRVPALPRPGARLAGHDAQPGADRPAGDPLRGPRLARRAR